MIFVITWLILGTAACQRQTSIGYTGPKTRIDPMLCPPPVPVNIPLILAALASLPAVAAWLGSKLKARTRTDLKAIREIGRASARRKMATPIGNVALLSDTLKGMGYAVAYDAGRLRVTAARGSRGIEFQGQVDGTWEAQVAPAISDAAFRAQVKVIVAAYARKAQTRSAERFLKGAPKFGREVKLEPPAPVTAGGKSALWTPPARQAVKVGAR
jgi:hypothetical protein